MACGTVAARTGWLAASLLLIGIVAPAPAMAADDVDVIVQIDGRPLSEGTETKPIRLDPKKDSVLSVDVVNRGNETVTVRIVRLEGRVVGLTFFAYDTAVGLTVPPRSEGSRRFTLDLGGLDGQATGLVPGAVKLLDNDRDEVASVEGVVDVRGSIRSVYGLFGVGVAAVTVLSFLACMSGLARHRLHPNRWRRAMRFLTPGLGFGLLLNFTLSATRVFVPAVGRWLTIVVVCSLISFALGYLTPAPDLRTDEEVEEDEEERLALGGATRTAIGRGHAAPELGGRRPEAALGPSAPPEIEPAGPPALAAAGNGAAPATLEPAASAAVAGEPTAAPWAPAVHDVGGAQPAPATMATADPDDARPLPAPVTMESTAPAAVAAAPTAAPWPPAVHDVGGAPLAPATMAPAGAGETSPSPSPAPAPATVKVPAPDDGSPDEAAQPTSVMRAAPLATDDSPDRPAPATITTSEP